MKKIKTSELVSRALSWAVGMASGVKLTMLPVKQYPGTSREKVLWFDVYTDPPAQDEFGIVSFSPASDWAQGGPIIERERINLEWLGGEWAAKKQEPGKPFKEAPRVFPIKTTQVSYGSMPLIAAMRCYVASKLGDEVEIPEELA